MDWTQILLWALALVLVGVGIAGTVLPALPGALLVLAGLSLGAWADGFAYVSPWTLAGLAALAALTYGVDFLATALGAKRAGASRRAIFGAALGTLAGLFFGIPGLVLGPFVGATIGELTLRRSVEEASKAGFGAWLGMVFGTAAKLAIVFTMIGIFALARFL